MSNAPHPNLPSPPPKLSHNEALSKLRTCLHQPLNAPTWLWICSLIQQLDLIALDYIQAHVTDRWPKQWLAMIESFDGVLHSYDLRQTDFRGLHLDTLTLIGCDLAHADFSQAHIGTLTLAKTKAKHLKAQGLYTHLIADASDLSYADLRNATLPDAHIFNGTRLCHAQLHKATLSNARLRNADLRDTDLSNVTIHDPPKRPFSWALTNQNTTLPTHHNPPLDLSNTFHTNEPSDPTQRVDYLQTLARSTPNARTWMEICALAHREDTTEFDQHVRDALSTWPEGWNNTRDIYNEFLPESFDGLDLRGLNLARTTISNSSFAGANLFGGSLSYTDLNYSSLFGANLHHVDFFRTEMPAEEYINWNTKKLQLNQT